MSCCKIEFPGADIDYWQYLRTHRAWYAAFTLSCKAPYEQDTVPKVSEIINVHAL